ncbi:MAG: hypothetical protein QM784_09540 [Polyangiaceae bacterium]
MIFENFELSGRVQGIQLLAFGKNWDLHNFADFVAITHDVRAREVCLKWRVPPEVANPWGDYSNHASGCDLVFTGVRSLRMCPSNGWPHPEDDLTVEEIAIVVPGGSTETEYAFADPTSDFALRFDFCSRAWLEIVADRVRLIPLSEVAT